MADSTVVKYRVRIRKPPSQTWKSFLRNHANEIVAIDFFIVPTVTFNILYGFVVLLHNRRQVVHFNATAHPTALWTAQQIIEAFPEETAPRFLLRDRDSIYGEEFRSRVARMGIEEVITTARSPWQNPKGAPTCWLHTGPNHFLFGVRKCVGQMFRVECGMSLSADRSVFPEHIREQAFAFRQ